METPEPLVVTRFPIASVPVCVVSRCVFTSMAKCVLRHAHSVGARACVRATACVDEAPCVSGTTCVRKMACVRERPCVRETACVRSLCVREMAVGMRERATACPSVSVMVGCVSVVTRGSLCTRVRQRRRQIRDKGRVAAVVISKTAPGLHGSERMVRAVLRMRPPRARLRR